MKIPLRFQNTEYDCGTTCFLNALSYLYEREEIPVELIKMIYQYTLDEKDRFGVVGKGGTSRKSVEKLVSVFNNYSKKNFDFTINCTVYNGIRVNLDLMRKCLNKGGVVIARCYQTDEHYVLITKIDDIFAYIFDPYYLEPDYYYGDDEVAIVLNDSFTHNRLVKLTRLFSESKMDFSLLDEKDREIVTIERR